MAIQKGARRSISIDPAVDTAFSNDKFYRKLVREHSMTPYQRRKAERDRTRTTINIDIPAELIQEIKALAAQKDVTQSQLAALLIVFGLTGIDEGRHKIEKYRVLSRSPLRDYKIDLPQIPHVSEKISTVNENKQSTRK